MIRHSNQKAATAAVAIPVCPKCGQPAKCRKTTYGSRFACCGLWGWDGKPLVSPDIHLARRHCHNIVDQLWQEAPSSYCIKEPIGSPGRERTERVIRKTARVRTYRFIADRLNLPEEAVHIAAQDNISILRKIYAVASKATPQGIRAWAKEAQA